MEAVVVKSEQLNLPEKIARKLKGKEVELIETEEGILLKPKTDPIRDARGSLKGSHFSTERYLCLKKKEKVLER
ncbi:MAG: hypothetical protein FJ264_02815 [Planctomycetes bacterium]|nr:hypothetical protein [Planctomycetota bacterium]